MGGGTGGGFIATPSMEDINRARARADHLQAQIDELSAMVVQLVDRVNSLTVRSWPMVGQMDLLVWEPNE